MQATKSQKAVSARDVAISVIDRGLEESVLLERWAADDSARALDDLDGDDESFDDFDLTNVASHSRGSFDN